MGPTGSRDGPLELPELASSTGGGPAACFPEMPKRLPGPAAHTLPPCVPLFSLITHFFLFHEAVITLQPKEIGDPMVEQGVYHLVCPVCPLSLLLCPEKAEMLLDSFLDKYVQSCRPQWPLLGPTEGPDMACKEESGLLDDLV